MVGFAENSASIHDRLKSTIMASVAAIATAFAAHGAEPAQPEAPRSVSADILDGLANLNNGVETPLPLPAGKLVAEDVKAALTGLIANKAACGVVWGGERDGLGKEIRIGFVFVALGKDGKYTPMTVPDETGDNARVIAADGDNGMNALVDLKVDFTGHDDKTIVRGSTVFDNRSCASVADQFKAGGLASALKTGGPGM